MGLRSRERLGDILLHSGFAGLVKFVPLRPTWANIRVTLNCNSRCTTCYAWKNKSTDELTAEEIKDALRQLKEIGVKHLIFIGGEPLLRRDIGEIIKEASMLEFETIIIVTNGLLLEDKAEELLESGVTHITVSIDSIGEANDRSRGVPGNYERSINGIKAVQRLKKNKSLDVAVTMITTLLLNENVEEIPEIIETARSLGVHWLFNLLDPNVDIFNGIPFSDLLVKSEEKIDETIDYLKKARKEYPGLISACDHTLEFARNYLKGNGRYEFHCVHGYKMLYLGSHGEIYPGCWVMEPIGNIRDDKLSDIVESKKLREIAEKMYRMQCPGCTNRYESNVLMKHLISHRFRC